MASEEGASASTGVAPASAPAGALGVVGEMVRHVSSGQDASCQLSGAANKDAVDINILSPSKVPVSYRLKEEGGGLLSVLFKPLEVGTFIMDVYASGQKIGESPVFFKVYDSSLIKVSDIRNGVVGQPSQFRVDASQAGEGQLEISINDGEVPNHVQVLGGGRCLVHFTPEAPKPHTIDIKFNGEPVPGCPFVCQMADTSKVSVSLQHLELMPVQKKAAFQIKVDTADNAELAVSVTGPRRDVPVQVTGNVKDGFTAQFVPDEVGPYVVGVEYNNVPVGGTPFTGKAYDFNNVIVSPIPWGTIGKGLEFTVDASRAGEGNLEITISARGRNIPTQVHPQGSARFAVSFVPLEATDHIVNITFNKDPVPGAPFVAKIHTDPNRILVSGQSLAATAVGRDSQFTLSNVVGSADDIDIVIDSPSGEAVPAKVRDAGEGSFDVEFCPQQAGEHQIYLSFASEPIPGSPFACKVYDVEAIQVRECQKGIVGKPVTFLVETSRAGPGNLEVTVNNGQVPTSAQAQGNHTYAISFVPKEAKPHVVELKFNGENVPGSPFRCAIVDAAKVNLSGDGLEKVAVGQQATFFIEGQFDMGDPEVKIVGPNKRVLASSIRFIGEGHFAVDYNPVLVGDHQVEVKMGDVQVQGSPFVIKAYDVTKVAVSNITSGFVGKPVYFSIDASQAGAGNLEIIVSVNGKNVPNYVQSEGNAKFRVNFKPTEALTHMLSVKFNNEFVPNSPFACDIQGSRAVSLSGPGVQLCPAGRETHFAFEDGGGAGVADYDVSILSPSGEELPFRLDRAAGKVTYVPSEVGPHMVRIADGAGVPVEGSPFTCNVYDVGRIEVAGMPEVTAVGRAVTFTVDASKAGEGTLELVVTTAKTSVRAEVSARSRGLYDVTFVPQDILPHFINITFNEEHIQHSPFKCDVVDAAKLGSAVSAREVAHVASANGSAPSSGATFAGRGRPTAFEVDRLGPDAVAKLRIVDPSGKACKFERVQTRNNAARLKFVPKNVGAYLLRTPSDVDIQVKNVYDPGMVRVIQPEPAVAGHPSSLVIDTGSAGKGALSVAMKAAGYDVKHSIRDLGHGKFEVSYLPALPVPHRVEVRYNGALVPGAENASRPLEVPVRDPAQGKAVTAAGLGLYLARVDADANFTIDTLGRKSANFDVVITGPADAMPPYEAVPVRCYQQKDGNLLAEFQTSTVGAHKVEVFEGGRLIHGAPFHCNSYDPGAVQLSGLPSSRRHRHPPGVPVQFQVDRRAAGQSDLDVVVTSPLGDALPVEVRGMTDVDNVDLVEFRPDAPGKYKFVIRYGGEQIPESPVTFAVQDEDEDGDDAGDDDVRHELRVFGQGLQRAQVGTTATFEMAYAASRHHPDYPSFEVVRPDGSPLKCAVNRVGVGSDNGGLAVSFNPDCVGAHLITLRFPNGKTMEYPTLVTDTRSVRLLRGFDLGGRDFNPRLCAGVESKVTLAVDEVVSGPGKLEAELTQVDGDRQDNARRKAEVQRTAPDRMEVHFLPLSSGEHALSLKYNGFPLPFSPLRGWAAASSGGDGGHSGTLHGKVRLTGMGLARAVTNEANFFLIDGSKTGGNGAAPKVFLTANEIDVPVELRPLARDVYEACYVPKLSGVYQLSVTWGGRLVKGCPLSISTEEGGGDPSSQSSSAAFKVFCSGEGLRNGTLGKDICSFIDARKAGPGELSLHCVGPRGKTAYCELNDHQDGTFTLNLKPQESGRHQLSIKYGGQHVKGSPFSVRVSGAPDPEKVKVYGPGVEHGVLAMYQSRFICDTRGAGAGQLTVRIRGPKGAFRVEMQRESQKDRTILCKYEPTEPGDYRIEVKWSGDHVPGSPFVVMIFDTQEELARFLQGGGNASAASPGGPGGGGADVYGSIGASHYGLLPWAGQQQQQQQLHHIA